jgi:hypothetical protein
MKKFFLKNKKAISLKRREKFRIERDRKKDPIGSALIVTLVILTIVLIAALSIALTTIRERKAALESAKSSSAYQNAEELIEKALDGIWNDFGQSGAPYGPVAVYDVGDLVDQNYISSSSSRYQLYRYVSGNSVPQEVSIGTGSTVPVADIARIKITGSKGSSQRAIDAAVICKPFPKADASTVALYHFEDTGNTIEDSTTPQNNGTVQGTVGTDKGICTARKFDGDTGNYIRINDDASLRLGNQMTVEAWVKWDGDTDNSNQNIWRRIVGKGVNLNRNYGLWMCSGPACPGVGQGWLFQIYNGSGGVCNVYQSVAPDTDWHYLAGTFNNGNNQMRLYVDGVANGTMVMNNCTIDPASSNDALTVGYSAGTAGPSAFEGIIDEIKISDVEKSAADISAEYPKRLKYMP